jgi:hypothetical protein
MKKLFKDKNFSINTIGEKLRNFSFIPEGENDRGCYSTFNVNSDFEKINEKDKKYHKAISIIAFNKIIDYKDLDNEEKEYYNDIKNYNQIYYNNKEKILMAYYWDGDGTLIFKRKNKIFINSDCKKDYKWKYYEI